MIRFDIYNSIIDQIFKDICFETERLTPTGIKRNINLVFASNASGKSTFSSIIDSFFNKTNDIVNKFTNARSTMNLVTNNEGFNKCYRYDRMFATKSAEIYKGELIVSPKNADLIVKQKIDIDNALGSLLNVYKSSNAYKEIKLYSDHLKGSKIAILSAKKYTADKALGFYSLLNEELPEGDICDQYSIMDLLDLMTNDLAFLELCVDVSNETIKLIKGSFPDIDSYDESFYSEVLEYFKNHSNKVLNQICLMCGKTTITQEIFNERIAFIESKIDDYQKAIGNNLLFSQLSQFMEISFNSKMFISFQDDLKDKKGNELVQAIIKIGQVVESIKISDVKKNAYSCIIKKVLLENNLKKSIEKINELYAELKATQMANEQILNEKAKQRFVDNLKEMRFKYADTMDVQLKDDNTISITCSALDVKTLYEEILCESEKSVLSFSLFMSIIKDFNKSVVIIDDPIDSHDQKNKWFVLDKIIEYFSNNKALLIVFTHDLDVSKSLNIIDNEGSDVHFTNYLLTKKSITEIVGPSLFFRDISSFVNDVKVEIEKPTVTDNEKYLLPIGFLLRYLCKHQYKHLNEVDFLGATIPTNMITRKLTRDIGFINISDSFVHYKNGVDSSKLLDDLCKIMKVTRQSTNKPHYICGSIESDILIECIIADIVPNEQYQKDLVKILTALQIRNLLEKKIIAKIPTIANPSLKKCAVILEGTYGTKEPLLVFLKANKFMVDEFAHLESGLDALLTYDIDYIQEQLVLLKQII